MVPKRIGLASRSNAVSLADLTRVAAAINLQVQRDFKPIWNISASIVALPDPESIEPGVWPVFIVDDTGFDGALGLHLTDHNQPYALVQSGSTWSLTTAHEVLEMLADPSGNWLIPSSGITVSNGQVKDLDGAKFEYLVEVADPSEDPANAYMIDDVLVSDFYTPNFFDHAASPGVRYSFSGKITRPREILKGGYISWLNPLLQRMQQLRWLDATPSVVDLPNAPIPSGGRTTLRGFVDSHTKLPVQLSQLTADSEMVEAREQRIGYLRSASSLRSAAYTLARKPAGTALRLPSPVAAKKVLDANQTKLQVQGATKTYVGWRFENNWITRERAIVVLARSENIDAVRNLLPDSLRGVPIEVRRDTRPRRASEAAVGLFIAADSGSVREELAVPTFPGEVSFEAPDPSALMAAKAAKPSVKYQPPKGVSLAPITADMKLLLHVSPEQGWAQLSTFLNSAKENLVIGMYEFTAPHIEKAMLNALESPEKLMLTLDSPPAKGSREQTVEDTEQHLETKLGKRLDFAWALAGLGHEAPAKAFPTSYHIKVAVKDGKSVWLSSGNFNSSNQPEVDTSSEPALIDAARKNDRDWHVICDCPELADVFRKYLEQDFATASKAAKTPKKGKRGAAALAAAATATALLPLNADTVAARTPKSFFPAHEVAGQIKVKPLLTPDDYRKPILDVIKGAKQTFFMQTQYIHTVDAKQDGPPPFGGPKHMDLITAVADLIRRGVDVRIITSEYQDHGWIEKLQDAGFDAVEHLRIQPRVHNKGIIVDSSIAVVSSQNWSSDGTGANRDAGLIIYNNEAARYFEGIFLHDWVNMAAAKVVR
jgi:hypothetical protein